MNWVAEGSGYIKGRMILAVLAWYGTRFLVSKPMRSLLGESARVFWVKTEGSKATRKAKSRWAKQRKDILSQLSI